MESPDQPQSEEKDNRTKIELGFDKRTLWIGLGIFAAVWLLLPVLNAAFWFFLFFLAKCTPT